MKMEDRVLFLVDRLFREKASWTLLIKEIRASSGVDIPTAEQIALSHEGWRRLINYRINHEPECRKDAKTHMRIRGRASLVTLIDDELVIVAPRQLT